MLYAEKICPRCHRSYTDEFEHCTKDGTKLIKKIEKEIIVPFLIDSSESVAKKIIRDNNLIPKIKTEITQDVNKIGKVVRQQPDFGEKIPRGSYITIWVGIHQPLKVSEEKPKNWIHYIDLNLYPPQAGKSLAGIVVGDSFSKVKSIFGNEDRLERSWFYYIKDGNVLRFHYNEDRVDTITLELSAQYRVNYYQMLKNIRANFTTPTYKDSFREINSKDGITFFLSGDTIVALQIYAQQETIWQMIGTVLKKVIGKFKPCFP